MQGDIASQQVADVGGVGALWTRALEVGLATKLVRQRPPSIDDEPAFRLGRRCA
jgi:hypothetical protein